MDAHFLTPSSPRSPSSSLPARLMTPSARRPMPARCAPPLAAAPGAAEPVYLDVQTTGTLADLARARADLAIIALPPDEVAAAMEVAARIGCRAVLIIGSGWTLNAALSCSALRGARTCTCSGPTASASSAPRSASMPAPGPLPLEGSLALVSQSGALTARCWTGRATTMGFQPGGVHRPGCRRGPGPGAGLPRHRCAHPRHRGLPRRHRQRPPFHERAALGRARQAGGGAQGRPAQRRQRGRADALPRHRR